ncbi:hypothetical protein FH608_046395 [Nonomuraea phyllanthi]|uniref:Uncharacterized protein n=1 Tax=Nonomuraea phyllanthi TaxID=2219224 RepID=A0A5C4V635_9ACTN|nr:hypothetical protein [Nonomuraea phyllanthi]KAB8186923.1 hypothetical protein FH608_046395 [Nonomuraea phyllanthi]
MNINPIETRYRGYRFRSRTEARWAVFMDHLDVPWDYELEGYVVDGKPYLPDFLVYPDTPAAFWLEIKGTAPTADEVAKAQGLATGTSIPAYVYFGKVEVPAPDLSHITDLEDLIGSPGYEWDNSVGWLPYPVRPAQWELNLTPTAYRLNPRPTPGQPKSDFWWWMDCPYCPRAIIKLSGQVFGCPDLPDDAELQAVQFRHHTPRLLDAYRAARSARFEHGESG